MAAVNAQNLLRIGEAAARIGVSVDTLRRYAREGKVPFVVTPGGTRRFAPADVDALLTQGRPDTEAAS